MVVNILSQGGLNAPITGPGIGPYWMIGFIFAELLILIVVMIAFIKLVPEHKKVERPYIPSRQTWPV